MSIQNIVIIAGHAGSGKTHLSQKVSSEMRWPLLDKDTLTRPFVEAFAEKLTGNPHDRESEEYVSAIRGLEYRVLADTMWEVLESGVPGVVVTAPFVRELTDRAWLDAMTFDCELKGYSLTVVWVDSNPFTLRDRIVSRGAPRDFWKLRNWDRWVGSLPEIIADARILHIDNTQDAAPSLQIQARTLIDSLSA